MRSRAARNASGRLGASSAWFGKRIECPNCGVSFVFESLLAGTDTVDVARLSTSDTRSDGREAPESSQERPLPSKIGRYVPSRELGQGGFGVVYLAQDPVLCRDVALKLPYFKHGERGAKTNTVKAARFTKEAQSAAKLRHPNIVGVFDQWRRQTGPFIVYEYIPGRTLEHELAERKYSETEAVQLITILADALAYASENEIVHRDIKPANIMIDLNGRPQVMDFGLAESMHDGKATTGGKIAGLRSTCRLNRRAAKLTSMRLRINTAWAESFSRC